MIHYIALRISEETLVTMVKTFNELFREISILRVANEDKSRFFLGFFYSLNCFEYFVETKQSHKINSPNCFSIGLKIINLMAFSGAFRLVAEV